MDNPVLPQTHELLISRLKARDKLALNLLYDQYGAAINGIILTIVKEQSIAEEVLQDAFLKFWNKIDHYDPAKGRLFTWMANISRNLAIDKLRSKEYKTATKTDRLENFVTGTETVMRGHPNIEGIGVKELLDRLRAEERLILELVYFKGYTHSEISKEYDIPIGTVKTRLRLGLNRLRELLQIK